MAAEPVIVDFADLPWETWPDELVEERGRIFWKTLVSGDATRSEALTLGIAVLPAGETLHEHHHAEPELYLVLEGAGEVTIDGETRPISAGMAVFIAGNVRHSSSNPGPGDLRCAYVLAADAFSDVEYVF